MKLVIPQSTLSRIEHVKSCTELLVIRDELANAGKSEQAEYVHDTYLSCRNRVSWLKAGVGVAGVSVLVYGVVRFFRG
jgi:hypothetical protein